MATLEEGGDPERRGGMTPLSALCHYKSFLVKILSLKEVFDIFGIKAQKGSKPILHSFTNASMYITKYYGI